jgi:hypothetical protein
VSNETRVPFSALPQGAKFFDPLSGEFFVKHSDQMAAFVSGGDNFEGEVSRFEADEMVIPDAA